MMKSYFSILVVLAMVGVTACSHVDEITPPSEVPEISLISVSPSTVKAYEDEIVFKIEYTDGDGDLGSNDDTDRNVFVEDNRIGVVHSFRLQQLAPDGAVIPITGVFDIILPNTILTGGSGDEKVVFTIHVVDRAGHESNVIETPEITVKQN